MMRTIRVVLTVSRAIEIQHEVAGPPSGLGIYVETAIGADSSRIIVHGCSQAVKLKIPSRPATLLTSTFAARNG